MKLVLFDCDGTLADSFALICETMRRCFRTAGLPEPDRRSVEGVIGLTLDTAIHRLAPGVPAEQLPALVETYRGEFRAVRADPVFAEMLFPGIEPLLRRLALREDVLLGVVTGKSRRGTNAIIETHRLDGIFATLRTADDCPSKPHPAMVLECCSEVGIDPAETLVIGDAIYDMQMARTAGACAVGVAWGAGGSETLMQNGAEAVAPDVDVLSRWIDRWLALDTAERPAA